MSNNQAVLKKVKELPQKPGVYQFFDKDNKILYIGKATNLRSRVQSYFRKSTELSPAKQQMVVRIADLKTIVVDSETEALMLEVMLINKHRPPYNILMRDDKSFQYIHISDDPYPVLQTTRTIFTRQQGRFVRKSGYFFGPYTSGRSIKTTLRLLKSIFKYCDSPPKMVRGKIQFPARPCLEYQMGRCIGPCANAISQSDYREMFKEIRLFLAEDYQKVRRELQGRMKEASDNHQFEQAAKIRDQIQAIDRLTTEQKVISSRSENVDYISLSRSIRSAAVNLFIVRKGRMVQQQIFFLQNTQDQSDDEVIQSFVDQYYSVTLDQPTQKYLSTENRRGRHRKMLEMGIANAQQALKNRRASFERQEKQAQEGLRELAGALGKKIEELQRIEIYDISNVQGEYAVGSMVVFSDGQADPAQYRKFKIKTVQGANDVAAMREVLLRRLKHLSRYQNKKSIKVKNVWPCPDLIIVDGGKGQLNAAVAVLDLGKQDIPVISLAKREEEIFVPGKAKPVCLPKDSAGLFLIQRMRDQAHRFAIGFYRRRHLQSLVE